jgi:hypothetical protein
MNSVNDVLRSAAGVSPRADMADVLTRPTSHLLGVSEPAAQVLGGLGIRSIFDLGASHLFVSAEALLRNGSADSNQQVAGDLLSDGPVPSSREELANLPLARLRMLSADQAQTLAAALDVETIADFANWPPHREARKLLREAVGSTEELEDLQTEELRPRFGQFPTERVYYSTLVLLEMLGTGGPMQELSGPLSLTPAVQQPAGSSRPAIGAVLTFEQSWFAQGLTLGHMLHSLSLAPGEVTRIAVIDWSRRTRAFASEAIGESEQLDTASSHARALSEVQTAVASDFQQGGSSASSSATSSSESVARASGTGLLNSLIMSGDRSSTEQSATTAAQATSSSWSLGNRSIMGSLTQNVNDRTEQHSSSVRNRRATAVREVSQSEHENVSTRVVANYNHMHALNMQYYEVVQVYRTEARLHRADRCLFIPMETLSFAGPDGWAVVERFRGALLSAALNTRVRSLIADDTTAVEIRPARPVFFPGVRPDRLGTHENVMRASTVGLQFATFPAARRVVDGGEVGGDVPTTNSGGTDEPAGTPSPDPIPPSSTPSPPSPSTPLVFVWDDNAVAVASRLLCRPLVRPDSDSLFVPDDTELVGISFSQVAIGSVSVDRVGTATAAQTFTVPTGSGHVEIAPGIRFVELDAISVTKAQDAAGFGSMTLHCAYLGRRFTLPSIPLHLAAGTAPERVTALTNDQADRRRELQQHLENNRLYYSQAVFQSLDAATLTFILGGYQLNGRPLIDQVEPRSLTIAGNYVVVRAPVADDEPAGLANSPATWNEVLLGRGLDRTQALDRRLIPIPTGGVFAEAVLGRSNSAEKLDVTRFWHWADSPIPIQPTEISPVGTGSRATPEDLTPGQLSPPVLNILNPSSVPDPSGLATVLGALTNLNFRDMSGLAGTQGVVQAAQAATLDAATAAGKLASENLKTEAQKAVSMGQIAADIAKSAIAADAAKAQAKANGGGASSVSGISRDGAVLNHGRTMDSRTPSAGAGPGGASGSNGSSDGGPSGDGNGSSGSPGGGPGGTVLARGHEDEAFQHALWGQLGGSGMDAAQTVLAADPVDAGPSGGDPLMSPFPSTIGFLFTRDGKLTSAFNDALAAVKADPAFAAMVNIETQSFVLVALNADGTRPAVSLNQHAPLFTGSLAKVAAMYAAFQLRRRVNDLAATLTFTEAGDVFREIHATFDHQFDNALDLLRLGPQGKKISRSMRVPNYEKIFTPTRSGSTFTFDFRADAAQPKLDFAGHLLKMIADSDNTSAGFCVQALGYGCINGTLERAGFFDPSPTVERGLWLAADYLGGFPTQEAALGIAPRAKVRINTDNDGPVGQAATSFQVARLLTLIHDDKLIDTGGGPTPDSANLEMQALLRRGVSGHAPTRFSRVTPSPRFTVLQSKIGVGELKGGLCSDVTRPDGTVIRAHDCVTSEAAILQNTIGGKTAEFALVYQNMKTPAIPQIGRLANLVQQTMDRYMT